MSNFWIDRIEFDKNYNQSEAAFEHYKDTIRIAADEAGKNFAAEIKEQLPTGFCGEKYIAEKCFASAKNAMFCAFTSVPDKHGCREATFDYCGYVTNVRVLNRSEFDGPGHPFKIGVRFFYCFGGAWLE